ncbi:MAG: hypothetical protein R2851_14425 [Caldilineaceae bacterium]
MRVTGAPAMIWPPWAWIMRASAWVNMPEPPRGRFTPLTWYMGCQSAKGAQRFARRRSRLGRHPPDDGLDAGL